MIHMQAALRAIAAILPLLLIISALPLITWHADRIQTEARRQLAQGLSGTASALTLKFYTADLNGWQTAYALDFMHGTREAAADEARARRAFLEAVARFEMQLKAVESEAVHSVDLDRLRTIRRLHDSFMQLDKEIIASLRSSDRNAQDHAIDLVLGREIDLFNAISDEVERLGNAIMVRSLGASAEAESIGQSARVLTIVSVAVALLLAAVAINTARRWMHSTSDLMSRLEDMALTDQLTGVANRRQWNNRLDAALAQAARHRRTLIVAIIDVDFFKRYNDQFGHVAGDALLREMAQQFSRRFGSPELFARFGGEEFVALMLDCAPQDGVDRIAGLRPLMPLQQTFSAGLACWDGVESGDRLLMRADAALYRAKQAGRNCSQMAEAAQPDSADTAMDAAGLATAAAAC
jgi:diguanylate cyclase (GGDEF)-like protein